MKYGHSVPRWRMKAQIELLEGELNCRYPSEAFPDILLMADSKSTAITVEIEGQTITGYPEQFYPDSVATALKLTEMLVRKLVETGRLEVARLGMFERKTASLEIVVPT